MNVPASDCQSQCLSQFQFKQHLLPHKQKERTEFRCRPIRSSSCTTKVNTNGKNNQTRKNNNLLINSNEKQMYNQMQRSIKIHQNKHIKIDEKIQKMMNNQLKINLHLNLNERNRKIKLNVPRKISASPVPQSKKVLNLQRLQPFNSISNSHSNSNRLYQNYSVKMGDLQIISLHSNGSQTDKQQLNTINDERFYTHYNSPNQDSKMAINDIDIEYLSKATMKYNSHHQHQQLKSMLLELADNHNQMMSMLKQIVKQRKQGQKNQQHGYKLIRQPSTNKQNLKINRAFNQKIQSNPNPNPNPHPHPSATSTTTKSQKNTAQNPRLLKQKSISQSIKREMQKHDNLQIFNSKLPSFVASVLVQVLAENGSENYRVKATMQEMVYLRELVSRRFQAYAMGYSQFLEMIIVRNRKYMSIQQVRQMLRTKPFLLNQSQIQFLQSKLPLVPPTPSPCLSPSPCPCPSPLIPISQLCQKLRPIINPQKSHSQTSTKMLIHHIKSALSTDGQQLAQMINNVADNDQYIDYRVLERVLRQWKMGQEQIDLLVARLCICSQSVEKLQYKAIFTGQLWY